MAFNKKAHLQANIEAIRIAFTLDREYRLATEEERAALQKYCGFGGIKCILKSTETEKDKAYWNNSEIDLFPMVADLYKLIRENSKDESSMEADGIISREVYAEVPPRVEYELTELGMELFTHIKSLVSWAEDNINTIMASRRLFETKLNR
jgi:hypothetical protein